MTSRIQTLPADYQPKVAKRVAQERHYSAEEQHVVDIINKWYPELRTPSKYGDILTMGLGLQEENGEIKEPHVTGIVIYVKHKNDLTANIPAFLDGIPVTIVDTGGGITTGY